MGASGAVASGAVASGVVAFSTVETGCRNRDQRPAPWGVPTEKVGFPPWLRTGGRLRAGRSKARKPEKLSEETRPRATSSPSAAPAWVGSSPAPAASSSKNDAPLPARKSRTAAAWAERPSRAVSASVSPPGGASGGGTGSVPGGVPGAIQRGRLARLTRAVGVEATGPGRRKRLERPSPLALRWFGGGGVRRAQATCPMPQRRSSHSRS